MSGGELDYFYYKLEEHSEDFPDPTLKSLSKDLARLYYELEWWLSGDTDSEKYSKSAREFKEKWLKDDYCKEN